MRVMTWLAAALAPVLLAAPAWAQKPAEAPPQHNHNGEKPGGDTHVPVVFTLRTGIADGRMVYIGLGGDIAGKVNPTLKVHEGETVQINLVNGEGAEHDIVFDAFAARSDRVVKKGASSILSFTADKTGDSVYSLFPARPSRGRHGGQNRGHSRRQGGRGSVSGGHRPRSRRFAGADPRRSAPKTVRVDLETVELTGQLDNNTTYNFWTFNGKVPGPFLRVRVGDTVEAHLKNPENSVMIHSVDFHAAMGPGGGGEFTQTRPGRESVVTFKALVPGLFVYHCATPSVAHHITNGMYGLILVEPEGGLPAVDREFYVMQGELYTAQPFGTEGTQEMDYEKLISERPEYFVFNGAIGALTKTHPLRARAGETIRIFFGVGGPNFTSSFHIIGEIFDRVYQGASFGAPPLTGVQTITVSPGGATVADLKIERGGRFTLVDHAMSRTERGLAGFLIVDGPVDDDIMHHGPAPKEKASVTP